MRQPDRTLRWMIGNLPPCDAAVIERPEISAALRIDFARPVAPTAARAAVQDVQLELRPWRFRLGDVAIPVQVWHGDLDRNVVVENGIYQANEIPPRHAARSAQCRPLAHLYALRRDPRQRGRVTPYLPFDARRNAPDQAFVADAPRTAAMSSGVREDNQGRLSNSSVAG